MTQCGVEHMPCGPLLGRSPSTDRGGKKAVDSNDFSQSKAMGMTLCERSVVTLTSYLKKGEEETTREHTIALEDVASITIRPEREEALSMGIGKGERSLHELQAMPVEILRSSSHTRSAHPFSAVLLKMQDGDEIEIRGVLSADAASLLESLQTGWQRQTAEKVLDEKKEGEGPLSPLNKYIASKRPVTRLSYKKSTHPVELRQYDTAHEGSVEGASSILCRRNKFLELMRQGTKKGECNVSSVVPAKEVQGNTTLLLTGMGNLSEQTGTISVSRDDSMAIGKMLENESACPPLTYLDPLHPGILHHLHDPLQTSSVPDTNNRGVDCDYGKDNVAAAVVADEVGPGRREAYLLRKLKEKTCDLERTRAELRVLQEAVERESEQKNQQEEILLGNFRHLTPAQRVLLNFDVLLEPEVTLGDFQQDGTAKLRECQLQLNRRFSSTFINQLRERSFTPRDDISQPNTVFPSKHEAEKYAICENGFTEKRAEGRVSSLLSSSGLRPAIPFTSKSPVNGDHAVHEAIVQTPPSPSALRTGDVVQVRFLQLVFRPHNHHHPTARHLQTTWPFLNRYC
ncbi:hypothetical protein MOQ_006082 [Trypanosoma cruzi marinkellei]|uniref:Uncharacterized protein n=1 Tax=Trypanosoma cruzi marinkellei TaxID=85056 RepID=K2M5J0_TRYCR|nr:hypothetical protein MOQ_006082 [Trypanosoma cruzi marinkellei]